MKKILDLGNMLLGTAAAATQIEGGDRNNTWYKWCEEGKIKDGSSCLRADDHYNRFREDLRLMKDMKLSIYRFGIEWSRLQPEEGRFDEAAAEHYLEEIRLMKEYGIKPLMTLLHFSLPLWFAEKGGFLNSENVKYFLAFTEYAVEKFGAEVSEYITINEPNVYAFFSYVDGAWPPGEASFKKGTTVMANLAAAHIEAYGLIHKLRREAGYDDTKVSFANHLCVFEARRRNNPFARLSARVVERFFQGALTKAFCEGAFTYPLKSPWKIKKGKYYDFHGVNYYTRQTVSGTKFGAREGCDKNDLGWEIYPEGIARVCEKLYKKYPVPVFITENGTCDNNDSFRARYIYEHLKALVNCGAPVERYYHWTFTDNFEWLEGESARFGLVHVDYETQKRTVKNSGRFFTKMIEDGGVTEETAAEYGILAGADKSE